jgi:hypothetical protein
MNRRAPFVLLATGALALAACDANPDLKVGTAKTSTTVVTTTTSAPHGATTTVGATTTAATIAATTTTAVATTTTVPTSTTVDPGSLAQTKDKPVATDQAFTDSMKVLWQAIVDDKPDAALPVFFPLSAYKQVKTIANPATDYQNRLIKAFTADIHTLHGRLGTNSTTATYVGVKVTNTPVWVGLNREQNKVSYWRVYDSTMTYTQGGKTKTFVIKSLISWRGRWYVVHLIKL